MRGSMHKGINCRDAASIVDGEFSPCGCGLWPRAVLAGEYDTQYTVDTKYTVLCIVCCVLLYTHNIHTQSTFGQIRQRIAHELHGRIWARSIVPR